MTPEAVNLVLGLGGIIGTLVGTLIGAILGYRGALKSVRLQLDHQDRTRFHTDKLDVYSQFLSTMEELRTLTRTNWRHMATNVNAPEVQQLARELWEKFGKVRDAQNRMSLLAPPEVSRTASELLECWHSVIGDRAALNTEQATRRLDELSPITYRLREQLRKSLGVE